MKSLKIFMAAAVLLASLALPSLGSTRQASIYRMQNRVETKAQGSGWGSAYLYMSLYSGDKIRTGSAAKAQIMYSDGSITRIGSQTIMTIQGRQINLNRGKLYVKVKKGSGGFKVRTRSAVAAVMGTEFIVDATETTSKITVLEGKVEIMGDIGNAIQLDAGTSSMIPLNQAPSEPVIIDINQYKQNEPLTSPIENKNDNVTETMPDETPDVIIENPNVIEGEFVNEPLGPDNKQEGIVLRDPKDIIPQTGELEILIK